MAFSPTVLQVQEEKKMITKLENQVKVKRKTHVSGSGQIPPTESKIFVFLCSLSVLL